jgi:tetratricopeptide (TPR) repeat protein
MVDTRAALQPLGEAESFLERLRSYETDRQLADAVSGVWRAAERTLRLLLRGDPSAPDELRLNALSADVVSTDAVVVRLRRADAISLELAGLLHELSQAAVRAEEAAVRAADADVAIAAVERLGEEVRRLADTQLAAHAHHGAADGGGPDDRLHPVPPPDERRGTRRLAFLAGFIFMLGGFAMLIMLVRGGPDPDAALEAFRAERFGVAEREFRAVLARDPANVTAMLYLGRIYRRQGRLNDAAEVLEAAVARAPDDPDVLRELGHLFMDLQRPRMAIPRYHAALERDPDEDANWISLISALRAADDPAADEWLRRAPAAVRAALTRVEPPAPFEP